MVDTLLLVDIGIHGCYIVTCVEETRDNGTNGGCVPPKRPSRAKSTMQAYLDLLDHVLLCGLRREDRTGTGTLSVFGCQLRFDLQEGFPLVTTKRVWFRALACEMLWFLSGSSNIKPLVDAHISIWTDWPLANYLKSGGVRIPEPNSSEWNACKHDFEERIRQDRTFAEAHGDLGPVYGRQWRDFRGKDQITAVIHSIRNHPESRRHIVSAWDPSRIHEMALPPCHMFYQFYVGRGTLSCHLYIRSNDLFLGAPFNIAQYALLTHMVAQQSNLGVGELVYTIGDAHAYLNHLDQIRLQLERDPLPLPQLKINRHPPSIFDYAYEDFVLEDYRHHPAIRAPIAV